MHSLKVKAGRSVSPGGQEGPRFREGEEGDAPEWVARTLGHVDTTMVYRTYGCYIPHLTRPDGSAFERQYAEALSARALGAEATKKGSPSRHNFGHDPVATASAAHPTGSGRRWKSQGLSQALIFCPF
jgi:hypothetical protein